MADETITSNLNAKNGEGGGSLPNQTAETSNDVLETLNTEQQIFDDSYFQSIVDKICGNDTTDEDFDIFIKNVNKFKSLNKYSFIKFLNMLHIDTKYKDKIPFDILGKFKGLSYKELLLAFKDGGRKVDKINETLLDLINFPYNYESFQYLIDIGFKKSKIYNFSKWHELETICPSRRNYEEYLNFCKDIDEYGLYQFSQLVFIVADNHIKPGGLNENRDVVLDRLKELKKSAIEHGLDRIQFMKLVFLKKTSDIPQRNKFYPGILPNDLEEKILEDEGVKLIENKNVKDIIEYCNKFEIVGIENEDFHYPYRKKFTLSYDPLGKRIICRVFDLETNHATEKPFLYDLGGGFIELDTNENIILAGKSETVGGFNDYNDFLRYLFTLNFPNKEVYVTDKSILSSNCRGTNTKNRIAKRLGLNVRFSGH